MARKTHLFMSFISKCATYTYRSVITIWTFKRELINSFPEFPDTISFDLLLIYLLNSWRYLHSWINSKILLRTPSLTSRLVSMPVWRHQLSPTSPVNSHGGLPWLADPCCLGRSVSLPHSREGSTFTNSLSGPATHITQGKSSFHCRNFLNLTLTFEWFYWGGTTSPNFVPVIRFGPNICDRPLGISCCEH